MADLEKTPSENTPAAKTDGNVVSCPDNVTLRKEISGENNIVQIARPQNDSSLDIFINGNGNRIEIDSAIKFNRLVIRIGSHVKINNSKIIIGKDFSCRSAEMLLYSHNASLRIGQDCMLAIYIHFRIGELPHLLFDTEGNYIDKPKGIVIGDHVWIGDSSYILKNATIGSGSVVGIASVVTKAFSEENVVIAGNPARICKRNIHWERNKGQVDKDSIFYKNLPDELKK